MLTFQRPIVRSGRYKLGFVVNRVPDGITEGVCCCSMGRLWWSFGGVVVFVGVSRRVEISKGSLTDSFFGVGTYMYYTI